MNNVYRIDRVYTMDLQDLTTNKNILRERSYSVSKQINNLAR